MQLRQEEQQALKDFQEKSPFDKKQVGNWDDSSDEEDFFFTDKLPHELNTVKGFSNEQFDRLLADPQCDEFQIEIDLLLRCILLSTKVSLKKANRRDPNSNDEFFFKT